MPNRMLSGEIARSESLSRVSMEAELTFLHLISVADDYGRFDGRPAVLLACLYPTRLDVVSAEAFARWLGELEVEGLIRWYEVDGRRYMELPGWSKHQRLRDSKPRYPEPPAAGRRKSRRVADKRGSRARASEAEDEKETRDEAEDEKTAAAAAGSTASNGDAVKAAWSLGLEAAGQYRATASRWELTPARRKHVQALLREHPDDGSEVFARVVHGYRYARRTWAEVEAHFEPETLLRAANRAKYLEAYQEAVSQGLSPPFAREPAKPTAPLKRFGVAPSVEEIKEAFHRQGGAR